MLPPPPEGDCVTEDGSLNEAFIHEGLVGGGHRVASAKARAICEGCPVLVECQQWAQAFDDWAYVTVAGWTAAALPSPPPWAEDQRKRSGHKIRVARVKQDVA